LETEFLGEARINTIAYPFALKNVLEKMRDNLVENVFEEDIFDWWTDCKQIVGESARDWRRKESYVVMNFGLVLAKVFFALRSFDFYGVKEDILGELYQHYFDPETRKALGEFYTPIEVVDYILDAVDYDGRKILNRRLLDPACGSGTFVVEALKRYLREAELLERKEHRDYWARVLRDLCERPKIIGFDINPFAVLMAQIRFMMELVPYYKRARDGKPGFTLTTIPVFRTDSLEIETKTGMLQRTLDNTISFSMRLPIVEEEEKFIEIDFFIPSWELLRRYLQGNMENYFILLKLTFDVIKDKARKGHYKLLAKDLAGEYQKRFDEAPTLAGYLQPYAQEILTRIKELREKYKDGRLIKSLEDLVLAGILKNFFTYNYVVGNPPYVRVQTLPKEAKMKYSRFYETATGNYDIYIPFIERGISWLNRDGRLGYINPNRFATVNYGERIRDYILNNTGLLEYLDFRHTGVFKEVLNYPAIVILKKKIEEAKKISNICRMIKKPKEISDKEVLIKIKENFENISSIEDYYSNELFDSFGFDQTSLSKTGWFFMPTREHRVYDKIFRNSVPLVTFSKTKKSGSALSEGSSTGAKKIYVVRKIGDINKNVSFIWSDHDNRLHKIENALLKPYIEDTGKWHPNIGHDYLIFPYKKHNATYTLISEEELEQNYPLTFEYLSSKKKELLKRKDIRNEEYWYAYSAPRNLDYYEEEKILVQGFSINSSASIDPEGNLFFGPDIYGLRIKDEHKNMAYLLLAILNSNITNFYIKHVGVVHGSGYYKFEDRFIKNLPIKLPKTKAEQKLADEITSLVEEILALAKVEQRIQNFPEPYFEELKDEIEEYDLVKWRAKRSYKELKPVLEPEITGGSRIILGKDDFIRATEIDSELKEKYVIKALKGRKARKDEEFRIKVPRSDAMVKKILDMYEKDEEELRKKSIAELEDEINKRVYRLYGLSEEDRRVIEEFLERF
jgi:hypothetical protein